VIRGWTSRILEYWQSIQEQRQGNGFLKRPSAKRAGELLNLSRKPTKNNDEAAIWALPFERTFI
jgi:hypothetical protein